MKFSCKPIDSFRGGLFALIKFLLFYPGPESPSHQHINYPLIIEYFVSFIVHDRIGFIFIFYFLISQKKP